MLKMESLKLLKMDQKPWTSNLSCLCGVNAAVFATKLPHLFLTVLMTERRLVAYGGRSWSIFKSSDMSLVYDSGNDLEKVMAEYFPWTFNSDNPDDFCTESPVPSAENDAV